MGQAERKGLRPPQELPPGYEQTTLKSAVPFLLSQSPGQVKIRVNHDTLESDQPFVVIVTASPEYDVHFNGMVDVTKAPDDSINLFTPHAKAAQLAAIYLVDAGINCQTPANVTSSEYGYRMGGENPYNLMDVGLGRVKEEAATPPIKPHPND